MTTAIAPADIQALKQQHSIEAVVRASGVRLRGQGRVLQGTCPFHEDHAPSFTVYRDTERFFCFGCAASGDVLDYLQLSRRVDLSEAIRLLEAGTIVTPAAGHRLFVSPRDAERCESPADRAPDAAVLAAAARYYAAQLQQNREARRYLASRGVSPGTALILGLGYSPGAGLREHLERAGFPAQAIAESGLFMGDHERFTGRVVVPHVVNGRVTWMVGRGIEPSMEPRFQALPGPKPVLGIGRHGGARAVVLTEGLFDWLTLVQWGLPACATLGGHSLERVVTALSGCRRVYLAMDADDAGHEATERLAAFLGARAVPLTLPAGVKDVADLAVVPDGRRTFLRLIERARRSHCQ